MDIYQWNYLKWGGPNERLRSVSLHI